jgi:hypothetical protein
MSINASCRGINCSLCYVWLNPQRGTVEKIVDSPSKRIELRREYGCPNHKDEIPTRRNVIIDQPDGFAYAALGAIAIMGFAELLAHDKATTCATCPISACIENQQWMRP